MSSYSYNHTVPNKRGVLICMKLENYSRASFPLETSKLQFQSHLACLRNAITAGQLTKLKYTKELLSSSNQGRKSPQTQNELLLQLSTSWKQEFDKRKMYHLFLFTIKELKMTH